MEEMEEEEEEGDVPQMETHIGEGAVEMEEGNEEMDEDTPVNGSWIPW